MTIYLIRPEQLKNLPARGSLWPPTHGLVSCLNYDYFISTAKTAHGLRASIPKPKAYL